MRWLWISSGVLLTLILVPANGASKDSPPAEATGGAETASQNESRSTPAAPAKSRKAVPKAGWEGTPLTVAAYEGNLTKVRALLKGGAEVNAETGGWSAMEAAASHGHTEVVKVLIEAGADVKGRLGRKALKQAILGGHSGTARALIASGVDVKGPAKNEFTPLAIRAGHPEMLAILHEADRPK